MSESVEALTSIPTEPSASPDGYAGPTTDIETVFAEVLSDVVRAEAVSVDSHFFDDLGANSLVMAQFCARVRKRDDVPSVSMKDVYRNPTIRSLATALADVAPDPVEAPASAPSAAPAPVIKPVSTPTYVLCAALQLLGFFFYSFVAALVVVLGVKWVWAASGLFEIYLRLVVFAAVGFVALCAMPIVVKWTLVGRWKPRQFRVWSLDYFRFWVVKMLVQRNLVVLLFYDSPLYVLYLRALGAKIGRGVTILSPHVPVCTDLLTIGEGTIIRKDAFFTCYRAQSGMIQTGTVTIGKNAFVGEKAVLDIGTSLGDGTQLGHASSLHTGQAVPDGECWHGSPAQRADVDYRAIGPAQCGTLRRVGYTITQLLTLTVVYLPLAIGGVDLLLVEIPQLARFQGTTGAIFTSWAFYRDALVSSALIFFGAMVFGLAFLGIVPRLLYRAVTPGKVYPMYGFHYSIVRAITVITNVKFFMVAFGDSSWIVHYLRYLGYDLSRVEQTGSNFGTQVKHDIPFLSSVGRGTMVADGLSIMNADFSSSSFRVSRVSIGAHNFVGNHLVYPAQGKTADNCLLATKLLVPTEGQVRENVGLLGSPSFEIPRTVERDRRLDLRSRAELRERLAAKNKHNALTLGMHLFARWLYLFGLTVIGWATVDLYRSFGVTVIALASVVTLVFTILFFALVERSSTVLHPLRPLECSIYDRRFWRHERYWKAAAAMAHIKMLNGTPFKNVVWRMLGVRLGRKVFDDGCFLPERSLVAIGDHAVLNDGSFVQAHSQEDGSFKSDHITVGANCTVGVGALVHYGATMGDAAVLAPDSFLMKGEEVPPRARWAGNPAREIRDVSCQRV